MARPPITRANPYTPRRGKHAGETFYSERQYRNALARDKGQRNLYRQQAQRAPRNISRPERVRDLSGSEQAARRRALEAVALMRREGLSLDAAAKRAGTSRLSVERYAGNALARDSRGRRHATSYDRLARVVRVATDQGVLTVHVGDSRTASLIAHHWNAIAALVRHGDPDPLRRFRGKTFRSGKLTYTLETNPDVLLLLWSRGQLSFDEYYPKAA